MRESLTGGLALLAALLAAVTIVSIYVSNEHDFYTSDYRGYESITHRVVASLQQSPRTAVVIVASSMRDDYNALFTLPLVPFVLVFGESRLLYETALTVAYALPLGLVVGGVGVRLIRAPARPVFWSTVALTQLLPMAWVPSLRGYPDAGGACLVWMAMWVYLQDPRLGTVRRCIAVGSLLSFAMLFRRHFAYDAVAFVATLALHALARVASAGDARERTPRQGRTSLLAALARLWPSAAWVRPPWRSVAMAARPVILVAASSLATLVIFGLPFLARGFTTNYASLYAAYMRPSAAVVGWYGAAYGALTILAMLVGFSAGLCRGVVRPRAAAFVLSFGLLSFLEWALVVRQTGEQYTLHFTPVVILGLAALVWSAGAIASRARRRFALATICTGLVVNFGVGLAPAALLPGWAGGPTLAMNEPPLARGDQATIATLVAWLREQASGQPIYVAASSATVNRDLFATAEQMLYGWNNTRLNLLYVPQVDTRDSWPLEQLLQAQYVILASPFQHHLAPEDQRVVSNVAALFADNAEFARGFVRLPQTFTLDEGVVVTVYQRIRPTALQVALSTLPSLERSLPRPAGQGDWLVLEQPAAVPDWKADGSELSFLRTSPAQGESSAYTAALYLSPLPERGNLVGQACGQVRLGLSLVDVQGSAHEVAQLDVAVSEPTAFQLPFSRGDDVQHLLLQLTAVGAQASSQCYMTIEDLQVQAR